MSGEEGVAVTLRLPSTLSAYSEGKSQIPIRANTIEQLFAVLARDYPKVWSYLCNEQGRIREHVKIFVNNELIGDPNDQRIPLKAGQEVIVLPAISNV